ncbi:hypothetical protein RGQ13_04000 [Thalassotalea psychrophila]|uniref:Uncharacterized protein n=1 Tax=Thalassotalea psychrophila TaxID=3065647 RepID=A0ABY9U0I3_9GAMM|nr:hypothetical protein RGQ13_04000 [Colwelliaceae bacterium SQ149]
MECRLAMDGNKVDSYQGRWNVDLPWMAIKSTHIREDGMSTCYGWQ